MVKRKISLLIFIIFVSSFLGCGRSTPEQSLIKEVNADDKNFKGVWVYKSRMGGQFAIAERTRINIEVSGKKFHLIGKWGEFNPPSERRTEEWVYDGKALWQFVPDQEQLTRLEIKELRKGPFWKMPSRVTPFAPPQEMGEEEIIAGRICKVLQTEGEYDQGEITLTYWIDEEMDILLKKEHLLEAGGMTLVHEVYECENIEFDPVFLQRAFEISIPSDWVKVNKRYLDCELLDTKF